MHHFKNEKLVGSKISIVKL